MRRPFTIRITFPGGDPEGIRLIEKTNWIGIGLVIPRALFAEGKQRRELSRTGVYVLVGPAEDSGLPQVYVGEGDPIRPRLEQHAAKKDFWTSCLAFTSKDENLNKAHVQHLEARLVQLASQFKRCSLDNGNVPALPSLSEADGADAAGFLDEMLLCFPVLGINVFSAPGARARRPVPAADPERAPQETIPSEPAAAEPSDRALYISAKGLRAEGQELADGFLVRAGSSAIRTEVPSCPVHVKEMRAALIGNGVLTSSSDSLVFSQDYLFPSPSMAAGVVQGRSSNGRIDWKTPEGRTLKELQDAEVST